MEKVYSLKILRGYFIYIDRRYGREVGDRILEELGLDRLAITDPEGSMTYEERIRMGEVCEKHTGEIDLAYHVGRALAETLGKKGTIYLAGLVTSPARVYEQLDRIESQVAFKTQIVTRRTGRNRYHIHTSFRDGYREPIYGCRNRLGSYEAIPTGFGLPFAKVSHQKCVFTGADACEYDVQLPEHGFIILWRLAFFMGLLALFLGLGLFVRPLPTIAVGALVSSALALIFFSLFKSQQIRYEMDWYETLDEEAGLQTRRLERTQRSIRALHGFMLGLSAKNKLEELCDYTVASLVKEFGYGSAQIWLTDPARRRVSCYSAEGYPPDMISYLQSLDFSLQDNGSNPYGLLTQTIGQKKTLVVNDVEEALSKLSPVTKGFLEKLDANAFAMSPMFQGETPLGIVTVEHHDGSRLENYDKLLLQALSRSLGDAVQQAFFYADMERHILLKTHDLQDTQGKLIMARKMSAHNEKLSGLGQLAAGVAHEINNPLNFLVNIIPDLKSDYETLDRIFRLVLAGLEGEAREQVTAMAADSDLEEHLGEREYIFTHMQHALDKSRRIAGSLKVFARSSGKEQVSLEPLAALVRDALELMPQKNKGDTHFHLDIPEDLVVRVNRIELIQVIIGLAGNSIDAMAKKGNIHLEASADQESALLSVRDDGPGIAARDREKVFSPFFTTKPGHVGLGLTVATTILQRYGGNVILAEPGDSPGACFVLRLPLASVLEEAA